MATPGSPTYQVTDPSTGLVVESFETATDADIEHALSASAVAYTAWRDVPIEDRGEILIKVGALLPHRFGACRCGSCFDGRQETQEVRPRARWLRPVRGARQRRSGCC
jgi:hypothetical protein